MGESNEASSSGTRSTRHGGNYSFYHGNLVLPHVDSLSKLQSHAPRGTGAGGSSSELQKNKMEDPCEHPAQNVLKVQQRDHVNSSKKLKKNKIGVLAPSDRSTNVLAGPNTLPKKLPPISADTYSENLEPSHHDKANSSSMRKFVLVKSVANDIFGDDRTREENISDTEYSVSSLSESDYSDGHDNTNCNTSHSSTLFEPIYSLPIKDQNKGLSHSFNKLVITNSKHKSDPAIATGSLPDLHSLEKCEVKKVSHVAKNESEAESEPGNTIRYKVRPLPTIPSVNISHPNDIEDVVSKSDVPSRAKPAKKSFRDAARLVTLIPRVPTSDVRGRKNDHRLSEICKYLPDRKLKLFVGTWNMKGTKSLPDSLDDFLLPMESEYLQDVYVIGTQEGTPFRHEWQVKLQETFGPSHVLMKASNFGVLQMSVFVRRELVWFCSKVEEDTAATRVGHKIKTKGALAMCFTVFGTSFLFINSHFTSHEGKLQERLNDYNSICNNLHFPSYFDEDGSDGYSSSRRGLTNQFDRVFWFGDFNFRVQRQRKAVDRILSRHQGNDAATISELLPHDQLSHVRGKIFHGFSEDLIHFMPTYKFDVSTDYYDTSSKQRVPSWTDRIMFKSKVTDAIQSLCYNSCTTIKNSDHRSVYSIFEVSIEPYKSKFIVAGGAQFDRDIYVEANMRRVAPTGSQDQSHVCSIL